MMSFKESLDGRACTNAKVVHIAIKVSKFWRDIKNVSLVWPDDQYMPLLFHASHLEMTL